MRKKTIPIPVNDFGDEFGSGILIEEIVFGNLPVLVEPEQYERHHSHSFFLIKKGTITMEIDFKTYNLSSSTLMYMHPDEVHRILAFDDLTVIMLLMSNEMLNPDYIDLLEDLRPKMPKLLDEQVFSLISNSASLCMKLTELPNDRLNHSLLKDGCNTLAGLVISQYIADAKSPDKLSRYEMICKLFKKMLEQDYISLKSPAAYASKLNVSAPYLNECVRNVTGHSVTYHIQQRVVLEAKRLLYYSSSSIKEIAVELGYEDYHYFSRLFAKVAGISAVNFRKKNFE